MTLPQRIAHIVNHGLAALHPCVYGDLTARGAVGEIAADLQKEIALLCPGRDAKEIVLQSTGKCIEIWERSAYDKMNSEIVDFASIVDQRLGHSAQSQKSMPNDVPCAGDAE